MYRLDIVTIFLTLFIPIAIVYFQDKNSLTEKLLEYFLNIRRIAIEIVVLLAFFFLTYALDTYNLPSELFPEAVGKQDYLFVLVFALTFIPISEIVGMYIQYFVFKKQSQSGKIHYLFRHLVKKTLKVQSTRKWIAGNAEIDTQNVAHDYLIMSDKLSRYDGKKVGVVAWINYRKIQKKFPDIRLAVQFGTKLYSGKTMAQLPNTMASKSEEIARYISSKIRVGEDLEEKLFELLKIVIIEIATDADSKMYVQLERNLEALRKELMFLAESDYLFTKSFELIRYIYFFMNTLLDRNDRVIKSIVTRFNRMLLLSEIKDKNIQTLPEFMSICLQKQFIELDDGGALNTGFVYLCYEVMLSLAVLETKEIDGVYSALISKLLRLVDSFTSEENSILISQIDEKQYLFDKEELSPNKFWIQILWAFVRRDHTIQVDQPLAKVLPAVHQIFTNSQDIDNFIQRLNIESLS